jgi:ribosomal protein S18 acetylase RimI-like enzyme
VDNNPNEVLRLISVVKIEELKTIESYLDELSDLLVKVVDDGASIGFLPPMERSEAKEFWQSVLKPEVILFIAKMNNEIVGTVQLHLCTKPNGTHKADVAKLMTHPNYRRHGIGRSLMQKVEERAKKEERSLLVLDTREGDPSNLLYKSLGFTEVGRIPYFARSADGELQATVIYYKAF